MAETLNRPSGQNIDFAAYGMVPTDRLTTENSVVLPEVVNAACEAASQGAWQPAAELLARIGRHWELRSLCTGRLGEVAAEDDRFVREWLAKRPYDADAAVIDAVGLVELAWGVRSSLPASHVTRLQFEGFARVLGEAERASDRAADMAPNDPTPLVSVLQVHLGLGHPHERFHVAWRRLVERAPHHEAAHEVALQYWCAKWHGSHELMFEFAKRAAASAPRGSLLATLCLTAMFEYAFGTDDWEIYRRDYAHWAIDGVLAALETVDPAHPRLPRARHLLAYSLTRAERLVEAYHQFTRLGPAIGSVPWSYEADPVKAFDALREKAINGWLQAGGTARSE
ncbi:hypothetical protein [Actinomadura sp. HBU206391]|uniref:hypothetical protein n=1 Tax=Actinomadura sp. HBU206391 TaxID=2731692 RepID=UPI001650C016|nr:hypothetical protein [Actinomadura sp. HBU206391]MBC6458879.1 hypothetical protein [Actinomadura sp. HBU206391]